MEESLNNAVCILQEIVEDENIAKTVKDAMQGVIELLQDTEDIAIKCDRAIETLTRNEDSNMDSFTRTQIWSLVSMLESLR